MSTDEPRAYTREECREMLLDHLRRVAHYWATTNGPDGPKTVRERLDGLVFSFLVLLDGGSGDMPAFSIAPDPHPTDREYRQSEGENWWPEDGEDIGGSLHEQWCKGGAP